MVELQRPHPTDQENLEKIREHLSKEGVRDVLNRIDQKFKRQPGHSVFYGITPDGLVVGFRKGCDRDGPDYYKAMAVDIKLPADQIEQQIAEASFSGMFVNALRDGGTIIFPEKRKMLPVLTELSKMTDEEIKGKYPYDERMLPLVAFYKKTGGFHFPTPEEPGRPSVGGKTVYPLNLS